MVREATTPDEAALSGFLPGDEAIVVNVEYRHNEQDLGHAIVQIGFPGKPAYYCIPVYQYPEGWRLEMPPPGDPRRRKPPPQD
jgi:hypothetical protein